MNEHVVILAARRTPIGAFQGAFTTVTAPELGAVAARAALADSGVAPDALDEVIFGCVLPAGQGQAPARQAAIAAGIATNVPATTVNKMCRRHKAVMLGADQIRAGNAKAILAGGLESMSNSPYLLMEARSGYRMGHSDSSTTCFTTACRAHGTASRWAASQTLRPRHTASLVPTRTATLRSPCGARSGP